MLDILENSARSSSDAENVTDTFASLGDLQLALVGGGCGDVTLH